MSDTFAYRYSAEMAASIETDWQARWARRQTFATPNPTGDLSDGFERVAGAPKLFVLDMFPYPSGSGLHVGHPLGYIGTDVYSHFKRMCGYNVLHPMGFDSFGLPAEQYAVQTGRHPRVTTEQNVANMRRQMQRLGLGFDWRRVLSTTDVGYYRWTQWIFLQLFNSWYDVDAPGPTRPGTSPASPGSPPASSDTGPASGAPGRARPISELIAELEAGSRTASFNGAPVDWLNADEQTRRAVIDDRRLVYREDALVNWCPQLGTVLANEEVTTEGRSERGNFPVFRAPLEQWKMRITAYGDRLLADLDPLDWSEAIKTMQRNWIGRSTGATVAFETTKDGSPGPRFEVFTTRPDTLFGATFAVVAPDSPLADGLVAQQWPEATPESWRQVGGVAAETPTDGVADYKAAVSRVRDIDRMSTSRTKTAVFTGSYAINPVDGRLIPVFVADYVLAGYGTGVIMAVPAHDQRDFEMARAFDLPVMGVIRPSLDWLENHVLSPAAEASSWPEAYVGAGKAYNSSNDQVSLDGLDVQEAKQAITTWLAAVGAGRSTVTFKLRDWLFSRQRYWGEPIPVVYDEDGHVHGLPDHMLPVELPELDNFEPTVSEDAGDLSVPEPPLARATDWVNVTLDLGDGPRLYRRETNTMPQWAGSCWYYLRYLDPTNSSQLVDPAIERYWMGGRPAPGRAESTDSLGESSDSLDLGSPPDTSGSVADNQSKPTPIGGVDLYVGGVEHAVLHLLYARFWHKVMYDLGHVSTPEPFQRLFNQGYVLAAAYTDERGMYVPAAEVVEQDGTYLFEGNPVKREYGKMGKSLKNSVTPDEMYDAYGADTLRLYEMFSGPLDTSRPWETEAVVGVFRFLQRVWRLLVDEETGNIQVNDGELDSNTLTVLHRTIEAVRAGMEGLRFNVAIARLMELTTALGKAEPSATRRAVGGGGRGGGDVGVPRQAAEALVMMLAPLAPHVSEELWSRLGHSGSVLDERFPKADPELTKAAEVTIAVQVLGKLRATVTVAAGSSADTLESTARSEVKVAARLGETDRPWRAIVVPDRLVNFVPG